MIKRFLHIVIWGLLIAAVIFVLAFVERKHNETVCKDFELNIINHDQNALTNSDELMALIIAGTDTLSGKTLDEISPYDIHLILDANPYVKYADVQTSIDGRLLVDVQLREAIVRIVNNNNVNYYIDEEGWLMPINQGFSSRVLIVNGFVKDGIIGLQNKTTHIDSLSENSIVRNIYAFAKFINASGFLKKLISQAWVSRSGELELIPVIGEYTIHFGGFEDMENKFEKLSAYYRKGAGNAGWINYKSIDLRYKNQVICSK